jgi:hypothetical protein
MPILKQMNHRMIAKTLLQPPLQLNLIYHLTINQAIHPQKVQTIHATAQAMAVEQAMALT